MLLIMLVTILYSVFGWISSDTFFPTYNLLKHFFHFSGPHIQLPCCGISFYDFAVCASIQLIFPCGFCHSWTNIVFAKVRWSFFFLVENICLFVYTYQRNTKEYVKFRLQNKSPLWNRIKYRVQKNHAKLKIALTEVCIMYNGSAKYLP